MVEIEEQTQRERERLKNYRQTPRLRERFAFDARPDLTSDSPPSDGYGNVEGDFEEQFSVAARLRPLRGGESVLASRLSGVQPVIIQVRVSDNTRMITTAWRARDVRRGTLYNITAISNMDERNEFFDILATSGAAV